MEFGMGKSEWGNIRFRILYKNGGVGGGFFCFIVKRKKIKKPVLFFFDGG
jgi:hypothetical protein